MESIAGSGVEHQISSPTRSLITIKAVAQTLSIPLSTAYELTRQNRIGGVVRVGRHIRFDKAKFEAWLEAGGEIR